MVSLQMWELEICPQGGSVTLRGGYNIYYSTLLSTNMQFTVFGLLFLLLILEIMKLVTYNSIGALRYCFFLFYSDVDGWPRISSLWLSCHTTVIYFTELPIHFSVTLLKRFITLEYWQWGNTNLSTRLDFIIVM